MATLGVGIVGTGWVSGEHIRAFAANPQTEILGLCGRTTEGAQSKAEEFGLECAVLDDFDSLLHPLLDRSRCTNLNFDSHVSHRYV